MRSLYEIDADIAAAILDCVDMETGEVIDLEKLEALQMERNQKLEAVALYYKNMCAEAAMLKAEEQAFVDRRKAAEKKAEGLKAYLSAALDGQTLATTKVAINFKRSKAVEIDNEAEFIEYAKQHDLDDLLSYKAPTISKTAVKDAINAGRDVPGAAIVERYNIQIK